MARKIKNLKNPWKNGAKTRSPRDGALPAATENDAAGKRRFLAFMFTAFMASIVIYLNSLPNAFVFNSAGIITNNDSVKSLWNIPSFFIPSGGDYSPLSKISFAADYFIYGLKPWGFRLTNILLHGATAVSVGVLAKKIVDRKTAAYAALVFAFLPVNTDAITGIVGRGEILGGLFFVLSFIFFIEAANNTQRHCEAVAGQSGTEPLALSRSKGERIKPYLASLAFFLFALLSSKTAVILPLLLLLYCVYFSDKKSAVRVAAYFIVSSAYLLFYLFIVSPSGYMRELPLAGKIYTSLNVLGIYLKAIALPLWLNAWHDFLPVTDFLNYSTVFSLQALVIVVFSAIAAYRFSKPLSFFLLFVLIALLPSLHILPQAALMKEAYAYLPAIGFSAALGIVFGRIGAKSMKLAGSVSFALFIIYGVFVFQRNIVWRDNYSLLKDTVIKSPESALLRYNMGVLYDDRGEFDKAVNEYETAVKLNPGMADAYYNLACVYARTGKSDMAFKAIKWALAKGFKNIELLETDPDLENLRRDPEFSVVMENARSGAPVH